MFTLLGIFIHLMIIFIVASLIALPFAAIVYWRNNSMRKQRAFKALLSPYFFIYTFYFCCLMGAFCCSTIFNTGCGMDGFWRTELTHGYEMYSICDDFDPTPVSIIKKGDEIVVDEVVEIKERGNILYGMAYIVDESKGHYFSLDLENDSLTWHGLYDEARRKDANIVSGLSEMESFYYSKWCWVVPLTILSLIISSGLIFLLWRKGGRQ